MGTLGRTNRQGAENPKEASSTANQRLVCFPINTILGVLCVLAVKQPACGTAFCAILARKSGPEPVEMVADMGTSVTKVRTSVAQVRTSVTDMGTSVTQVRTSVTDLGTSVAQVRCASIAAPMTARASSSTLFFGSINVFIRLTAKAQRTPSGLSSLQPNHFLCLKKIHSWRPWRLGG